MKPPTPRPVIRGVVGLLIDKERGTVRGCVVVSRKADGIPRVKSSVFWLGPADPEFVRDWRYHRAAYARRLRRLDDSWPYWPYHEEYARPLAAVFEG